MFRIKEVYPMADKDEFWKTHVGVTRNYNTVLRKGEQHETLEMLKQHIKEIKQHEGGLPEGSWRDGNNQNALVRSASRSQRSRYGFISRLVVTRISSPYLLLFIHLLKNSSIHLLHSYSL